MPEATTSSDHFFEGAEKLMEIWFTSSDKSNRDTGDLRVIPREEWEVILPLVNCEIVSVSKNESLVAYVLSESSMFIAKRRFILKTCGQTTLLRALKPVLELVKEWCGLEEVEDLFYSRKSFSKPQEQLAPHTSFDDEVAFLDKIFPDGAAYNFGRVNQDCWHLYTTNPHYEGGVEQPDQTLEILMTNLDEDIMKYFTKEIAIDGKHATQISGIDTILPKSIIDDFLFDPCGYSMNGLLPNGQYWTIHITPEPEFAYVSFETNVAQSNYRELIQKVLDIFKPGGFTLTLFANEASDVLSVHADAMKGWSKIGGFKRTDYQLAIVKNYNLTYSYYNNVYS